MLDLTRIDAIEKLADLVAERVAAKLAMQNQRRFISRKEYAEVHGLGMRTIDRAIAENRLSIRRSGRRVLIDITAEIADQ